jgi:cytochrome c oxidase subunit 2
VKRVTILVVVGAVLGVVVGLGILAADVLPPSASKQAENTDLLYDILVLSTSAIFGIVTAVLVFAAVRFRAPHGVMHDGPPLHGLTWLEVVWTAIPAVIVVSLTGISWWVLNRNDVADAKGHMTIVVHGKQWTWLYDYPEYKLTRLNQLVVPVNAKIRFDVESDDVIHGWWVPAWRIQMNATPGQTNVVSATPNKTGTYDVVCTFICGIQHPQMGTEVAGANPKKILVVDQATFDKYISGQKAAAAKEAAALAANPYGAAVKVFTAAGCGGCHAWKPAKSTGAVGPSLDDLAAAAQKAGKPLADYVRQSIEQPSAYIVPGYPDAMPKNFGSTIAKPDLDTLVDGLVKASSK